MREREREREREVMFSGDIAMCVCRLALDQASISELGMASLDLPAWVSVLIHCRLASRNPSGGSLLITVVADIAFGWC